MEVIKRRVLKTRNGENVTEELNTNKDNEFIEKENDGSRVDKVEIDRINIETDQTMEESRRAETYA